MLCRNEYRMAHAFHLADKCWGRACRKEPEFVRRYLAIAEQYLTITEFVTGDQFSKVCRAQGLDTPPSLDRNVWASGVNALVVIGWITKKGVTVPTGLHNHMNTVTEYKSNLYRAPDVCPPPATKSDIKPFWGRR
jgi:hypothetical protein